MSAQTVAPATAAGASAPVPAVPVRPRRADRGAHARPRLNAPSAARPRDPVWVHRFGPQVSAWPAGACAADAPAAPVPVPVAAGDAAVPLVARSAPAVATVRYEWTDRGIAVLLTLVGLVTLLVVVTLVSAFLAVSPDAPAPAGQAAAPAAAAAAPLRAR